MSDIKSLLEQYEEVNKQLNKQIQENGKEFIQNLFQDIFDQHKGLKFVMVRGWTPGFNDGEPCTHSQETFVGRVSWGTYHDFSDYELYDDFECVFDEDSDDVVSHINSGCESLDEVYVQVEAYSEIIERVFNTNFEIKASLNTDGKVVVIEDEYWCGY